MKFRCVVGKTMLPLRPQPRSGSKAFILDRVTLLVPTAMTTAPCAVNRVYTSSSDTQKTPVEQLSRSHCIGEPVVKTIYSLKLLFVFLTDSDSKQAE